MSLNQFSHFVVESNKSPVGKAWRSGASNSHNDRLRNIAAPSDAKCSHVAAANLHVAHAPLLSATAEQVHGQRFAAFEAVVRRLDGAVKDQRRYPVHQRPQS